jgi:hypothetical protein
VIPQRGWLVVVLSVLVLVTVCARARAADAPVIDCALVRSMVAEHGKARALAWAVENGYGWRDIRAARRCLASDPTKGFRVSRDEIQDGPPDL